MRSDWVAVVEATYEAATSDVEWGTNVVDVARPLLGGDVGLSLLRHPADCSTITPVFVSGLPGVNPGPLGAPEIRALFYPERLASTMSEIASSMPPSIAESTQRVFEARGVRDALGLTAHPDPGLVLVLYASGERPLRERERRVLTQVTLQIETAYRLRLRPDTMQAVLTPTGRLVHREEAAAAFDPSVLKAHVQRIESARSRKVRREPDALEAWSALLAGRSSLVPRMIDGKRHYLVIENQPARQRLRALGPREVDVLSYAARGLTTKLVAYALGVSSSSVSSHLASAASKVGLSSRLELVRIAAMLARDPRARFEETALTTSERDVLELLGRGLSNREIANLRGRSVRTIANQVASLLKKTKSDSRRTLVATPR